MEIEVEIPLIVNILKRKLQNVNCEKIIPNLFNLRFHFAKILEQNALSNNFLQRDKIFHMNYKLCW